MSKKLRTNALRTKADKLPIRVQEHLFQIAITDKLDNGYEIKDMSLSHLYAFHSFISDTIYKHLTISEVDRLYLRKEGLSKAPPVLHNGIELLHYGKANNPFRLFGYYDENSYFVICRIDGGHQTNRQH